MAMLEVQLLWAAVLAYVLAGSGAIFGVVLRREWPRLILGLMVLGLICHTGSMAERWDRLGHGPFITMFEILSSNIWSLMLAFTIAYWRLPAVRPSAAVVMPILFLMMGWLMMTSPKLAIFRRLTTPPGCSSISASARCFWVQFWLRSGRPASY
jgi:hypothetical protein